MKNLLMAAAGSVVMALGIVGEAGAFQLIYGETKSVGNGTARTWVELDHDNNPLSLGISFSEASLFGLPMTNTHNHDNGTHNPGNGTHNHDNGTHNHGNDTHNHGNDTHNHGNDTHNHGNDTHNHGNDTHNHGNGTPNHGQQDYLELPLLTGQTTFEYELLFPQVSAALPFTHMGFNWNDHGHGPDGIFDLPHFDIHFYTISPEERYAITAVGDDEDNVYKAPSAEYLPAHYVTGPGAAEPRMGLHWFDPTDPVFNGETFTQTFIYGSYDGNTVFWEPMITRDYLLTQPNMTYAIAQPEAFATSGYYPTTYSINYNQANQEYSISLGGLSYNSAPEPEADYDSDGGWTSPGNHGDACAAH